VLVGSNCKSACDDWSSRCGSNINHKAGSKVEAISTTKQEAKWKQSGSKQDAKWMQSGCKVDAKWMQSGCKVDAKAWNMLEGMIYH
jgi:hypothetical protein